VQAQGLHQAVSVLLLLLSLLLLLLQLLLLLLLYSLFGELYDACKGVRAHARTNTHTYIHTCAGALTAAARAARW